MSSDPRDAARHLAALAGLPPGDDRLDVLSRGLPLVDMVAKTIAAVELGQAEPPCLFRAPPPDRGRRR